MAERTGITLDLGVLKASSLLMGASVNRAVDGLMLANAPKVQDYARSNAPWTDRTSNARNGLFARYSKSGDTRTITVYHTVPYGVWLEVRHSGKYAIIVPTVDNESKRIMASAAKLLARLEAAA